MRLLVVTCALVVGGCSYNAPDEVDSPDGSPPPPPSSHAKKLVFDNSASGNDLVGFQVLATLDATVIDYGQIADPTTDLRFDDAEQSDLPFEIERWDPTGTSLVWVRVPTIDAGSTTDSITMDYGPGIGGHVDPNAVWGNYRVVMHLGDHLENSAGSTYSGTANGATVDSRGCIGSATKISPTTDRVPLASGNQLLDGWSQFTLESWIRLDYTSSNLGGDEPNLFSKGQSANNPRVFQSNGQLHYQIDWTFDTTGTIFRGTNLPLQTWSYVVWTFDGQTLRVFRDGAMADSQTLPQPDTLVSDGGGFALGNDGNAFDGAFDEFRLADTAQKADEVRARFLSMSGAFVTFADL